MNLRKTDFASLLWTTWSRRLQRKIMQLFLSFDVWTQPNPTHGWTNPWPSLLSVSLQHPAMFPTTNELCGFWTHKFTCRSTIYAL